MRSGPRPPRILTALTLAALAGLAGAGCQREDPVQTALEDARIKLRQVSPGGGLSRPEFRATAFREVSQSLRQVASNQDASPGQVASANLMLAAAEAGLASPIAAETTTRLNQASRLIGEIRSIAIERSAATSTATVLASYDPAPEIGEIDRAIRDSQAELEVTREDLEALRQKIETLRQSAAAELDEARGLRAAEADMRNEALGMDDIEAAQIIADAARIGRQADAHEVAAANLEAEADLLEPEATQMELRIEGLLARSASLNKAREGVGARAQMHKASASQSGERGRQYEAELDQLVSELIDLSRGISATATEAAEAYDRAASTAARAQQEARQAARAAAGKSRHSAAAMRQTLAEHLLETGDLLGNLAAAEPPLSSARTLSATAERLTSEGLGRLSAARESYQSALSDLQSAGGSDDLISALEETIKNIESRLQDAGAGGQPDAGDMGEDLDTGDPSEGTGQGTDGGTDGGTGGDAGADGSA